MELAKGRRVAAVALATVLATVLGTVLGTVASTAVAPHASADTGASRNPNGVGVGAGQQASGKPTKKKKPGVSRTYCRFFHIGEATPEAPEGTIGPEELQYKRLPLGTVLWRACYLRTTDALVEGPALWQTGTNPLARLQFQQLVVDFPVLETSPPTATLPNVRTYLWSDNETDQEVSVSMGGETITAYSELVETRMRIVPSSDPRLASRDDGHTVVCEGPAVAFDPKLPPAQQPGACFHRFAGPARVVEIETTTVWRLWWADSEGQSGEFDPLERTQTSTLRVGAASTRISPFGWTVTARNK